MSFSWSTSSFAGLKPATTISFADALKRLAEQVEEKNKNNSNNGESSPLIQSAVDFPNRINPSYVNNSIPPEQALRLYTQYIQEAERREDTRRCYLRSYGGSDASNMPLPGLNRRFDMLDPYRFMTPNLSSLLHPSAYLQTRLPPSPFVFPSTKTVDKKPEVGSLFDLKHQSSKLSKPKSKLFRPYDLDSSNSTAHPTKPSSPAATKKSSPSPSTKNTSVFLDELPTATSSGKEKQLFNSLGLAQQSADTLSEKSSSFIETSPSITISEDSPSVDINTIQQDNGVEKSLSNRKTSSTTDKLKRKSSSVSKKSSHRKQSKIDTTVE